MPTSPYDMDMEPNGGGFVDRTLQQLALELSMINTPNLEHSDHDLFSNAFNTDETRAKKSQNMTECVPVPSSEHVAEIVGRQGCKIKALRAKTNTYIKTPVRGEEPVFVVTGRREDVAMAKREILSAADHFSQIRASRKNNLNGSMAPGPPAGIPGQITVQVEVPYRVVGLVVGPKGATIKRIQQQTHTYIVTPSRDKEPVFEVTGLPDNVNAARNEIKAHIAVRTGVVEGGDSSEHNALSSLDYSNSDFMGLYKSNFGSTQSGLNMNSLGLNNFGSINSMNNLNNTLSSLNLGTSLSGMGNSAFSSTFGSSSSSNGLSGSLTGLNNLTIGDLNLPFGDAAPSSSSGGVSSLLNGTKLPDVPAFSSNLWGSSFERDEGLGDSPSFDSALTSSGVWGDKPLRPLATSAAVAPPPSRRSSMSLVSGFVAESHRVAHRLNSDPLGTVTTTAPSQSSSPTDSLGSLSTGSGSGTVVPKRDCIMCTDQEVNAAVVPCGHHHFCMDCANQLQENSKGECPLCGQCVTQAIQIQL